MSEIKYPRENDEYVDAIIAERDTAVDQLTAFTADNAALRAKLAGAASLLDGVGEIIQDWGETEGQRVWRNDWMRKAKDIIKEADQ